MKKIRIIIVFLLAVLCATLLKFASCAIPDEKIQQNIYLSKSLILEEGKYPQYFINDPENSWQFAGFRLDTVTEYAIMSTVFHRSNDSKMTQAMRNTGCLSSEPDYLVNYIMGEYNEEMDREQYWMGITVLERIMFYFCDYSNIRLFLIFLFLTLITGVLLLLYEKIGVTGAISFISGLLAVNAWVVMFSPCFAITFILAFISMILYLCFYEKWKHKYTVIMVIGVLTAYFDWMSTPLITYGFVIVVIIMLEEKNNITFRKGLFLIISNGFFWTLGYTGMIISKWVVGSIIMKDNYFTMGIARTLAGTSVTIEGDPEGFLPLAVLSVKNNFLSMSPINYELTTLKILTMIIFIVVVLTITICFHKPLDKCKGSYLFALIAITPYMWFVVFKGHTHIHYWFTYRIQAIFVMSIMCAILYCIDINKIKTFLKR